MEVSNDGPRGVDRCAEGGAGEDEGEGEDDGCGVGHGSFSDSGFIRLPPMARCF